MKHTGRCFNADEMFSTCSISFFPFAPSIELFLSYRVKFGLNSCSRLSPTGLYDFLFGRVRLTFKSI